MQDDEAKQLATGHVMLKYPKKASKKPDQRHIFLEFMPLQLVYASKKSRKTGISMLIVYSIDVNMYYSGRTTLYI